MEVEKVLNDSIVIDTCIVAVLVYGFPPPCFQFRLDVFSNKFKFSLVVYSESKCEEFFVSSWTTPRPR